MHPSPGPLPAGGSRWGARRAFRALVGVLIGGVVVVTGAGCSDGPDRRSDFGTPAERLQFKQEQVTRYQERLTPSQRSLLLHHPARSRADFEAFRDRLIEVNELRQSAADARVTPGTRRRLVGETDIYRIESAGGEGPPAEAPEPDFGNFDPGSPTGRRPGFESPLPELDPLEGEPDLPGSPDPAGRGFIPPSDRAQ